MFSFTTGMLLSLVEKLGKLLPVTPGHEHMLLVHQQHMLLVDKQHMLAGAPGAHAAGAPAANAAGAPAAHAAGAPAAYANDGMFTENTIRRNPDQRKPAEISISFARNASCTGCARLTVLTLF